MRIRIGICPRCGGPAHDTNCEQCGEVYPTHHYEDECKVAKSCIRCENEGECPFVRIAEEAER